MSKAIKTMNISLVSEDGAFARAYVNYDVCMVSDETMRKSEFLQLEFNSSEQNSIDAVLGCVISKINNQEGIV